MEDARSDRLARGIAGLTTRLGTVAGLLSGLTLLADPRQCWNHQYQGRFEPATHCLGSPAEGGDPATGRGNTRGWMVATHRDCPPTRSCKPSRTSPQLDILTNEAFDLILHRSENPSLPFCSASRCEPGAPGGGPRWRPRLSSRHVRLEI